MKKYTTNLWIILVALAVLISGDAQAQAATKTFTSKDQRLSFDYPSDWVLQTEPNQVVLANSAKSLDSEAAVPGGVKVSISLPEYLTSLQLDPKTKPNKVIKAIIKGFGSDMAFGPEIDTSIHSVPASSVIGQGKGTQVKITVLGFVDGTILVMAQAPLGELTRFDSSMTAMIESISFGSVPKARGQTIRQWASSASGTSQYGTTSWSFQQATGAPNTKGCGDQSTAWASSSSRGKDSLMVTYNQAVIPTQVNIYQTYNPGSIISIELVNTDTGEKIQVPNSADSPGHTLCPGVFTIDIQQVKTPINAVIIHLDQTIGGNWNEVDAVELVGTAASEAPQLTGLRQWASMARGTSQYGTTSWSFQQATGTPNTKACGDQGTAWASSSSRGKDSLMLKYDQAVIPTQVNIYQTYTPGSIVLVELVDAASDKTIPLPNSDDPPGNTLCPGVFTLNIHDIAMPVNGLLIHLDQTIGGNWNEIDAVELVGTPASQ